MAEKDKNNKNASSIVAFFDLDGTLCNARYLPAVLVRMQLRDPVRIPRALVYMFMQTVRWMLYKIGILDYQYVARVGSHELAAMIKGMNKLEVADVFAEAARKTAETVHLISFLQLRRHQWEGHDVILVSGAFQPFLVEVASLLGVKQTVGTELKEREGYYTGHIVDPVCHGQDRADLIRRFIDSNKLDVDLASSYAYGDRAQDIPMLDMVGHPVAVYPDKKLLTHAKRRGWAILTRL